MTDQHLSHNDKNRQLARKIGEARAQGTLLSGIDDPLLRQLLEYRQQERRSYHTDSAGKKEVWNAIDRDTQPPKAEASSTRLFSPKTMRWAAAAVLLIGALFSFIYVQFYRQPVLLAESGATIKTVQISDGSTVTLRPHSSLWTVENSSKVLQYRLQGEGFFEISPKGDRTFSVETKNGTVSVLGTRFMLSSWGNRMQVFLEEGSVNVRSRQADRLVVLKPGESVSITADNKISTVQKASSKEFKDWMNQQLIFEHRPAQQVVNELEQQFNISISLPADVANNRLTGQLSLTDLHTSLDDLTLVLGGTFIQTEEQSYRFEAR